MTEMRLEIGEAEGVRVKKTEHDHHLLPFIRESLSAAVITADIS